MSKRELIALELEHLPDQDLDRLLASLQSLTEAHTDAAVSASGSCMAPRSQKDFGLLWIHF